MSPPDAAGRWRTGMVIIRWIVSTLPTMPMSSGAQPLPKGLSPTMLSWWLLMAAVALLLLLHVPSACPDAPETAGWPCPTGCTCREDHVAQVGRAYAVLCSNQRLRRVPDLRPLVSVNVSIMLKLDYCDLANLSRDDFPVGLQLSMLHLNGNSEMRIAPNALQNVRETLLMLDMQAINLPFNDTLLFLNGSRSLQELSLSFNNKGSGHTPFVTAGLFRSMDLQSLVKLKLYNCNIRSLAKDVFEGVETLEDLHLGSNVIGDIPEALSRLHELRVLDLSSNDLSRLPNGSFSQLTKLRELKLHRNAIGSVEEDAFTGLNASLATLIMDFCSLREVPTEAIRPLKNLTTLDLTGNLFTDIGPDAFVGAYCLNELYVSSRTMSFDKLMFTGQRFCIKDLKIRRAELKSVPLEPIKDLVKLQYLFLDKNNITRLVKDGLKGIAATSISFSDNPIRTIDKGAFNGLKSKIILLMERTEVSDLSFIFDYPEETFRFFSLYESPIPCDCTLHRLLHMRPENFLYGTCSHEGQGINLRDPNLEIILDKKCPTSVTKNTTSTPRGGDWGRGGGSGGKERGDAQFYTMDPQVQQPQEKQLSLKSVESEDQPHQDEAKGDSSSRKGGRKRSGASASTGSQTRSAFGTAWSSGIVLFLFILSSSWTLKT